MSHKLGGFTPLCLLKPFLGRNPYGVQAEVVSYNLKGLTLKAWLYRGKRDEGVKELNNHPLDEPAPLGGGLVIGHGGVWGIPYHYDPVLRRLASAGWTVAVPTFRGEDGSEGKIEFALGEVDDTIACWRALAEVEGLDPRRIWLLGSSHGAIINLLILARDDLPQEVPGAVCCYGVYDLALWLDWLARVSHPLLDDPFIKGLTRLDSYSLRVRSPLFFAEKITKPVMLIHGLSDTVVPYEQSVRVAEVFDRRGKRNYHLYLEPDGEHEFIWAWGTPAGVRAWRAILEFIKVNTPND